MAGHEELGAGLAPDAESGFTPGQGEAAAWLFLVNPPGGEGTAGAPLVAGTLARAFEPELALAAERWLRRVSWAGDGRRGTARLELGAGALAGAELVVVAEGGHVSLDLSLPAAADAGLGERLRGRLEARGYTADVTVR